MIGRKKGTCGELSRSIQIFFPAVGPAERSAPSNTPTSRWRGLATAGSLWGVGEIILFPNLSISGTVVIQNAEILRHLEIGPGLGVLADDSLADRSNRSELSNGFSHALLLLAL